MLLQVVVEKRNFLYDHVYGWNASNPDKLYDQCVQPLVGGLFKGYNATVFAYGQRCPSAVDIAECFCPCSCCKQQFHSYRLPVVLRLFMCSCLHQLLVSRRALFGFLNTSALDRLHELLSSWCQGQPGLVFSSRGGVSVRHPILGPGSNTERPAGNACRSTKSLWQGDWSVLSQQSSHPLNVATCRANWLRQDVHHGVCICAWRRLQWRHTKGHERHL